MLFPPLVPAFTPENNLEPILAKKYDVCIDLPEVHHPTTLLLVTIVLYYSLLVLVFGGYIAYRVQYLARHKNMPKFSAHRLRVFATGAPFCFSLPARVMVAVASLVLFTHIFAQPFFLCVTQTTKDGTVSRDQILRRERRQGKKIFPVQLTTSRIGTHTGFIHTLLKVLNIHIIYRYSIPCRTTTKMTRRLYTFIPVEDLTSI